MRIYGRDNGRLMVVEQDGSIRPATAEEVDFFTLEPLREVPIAEVPIKVAPEPIRKPRKVDA